MHHPIRVLLLGLLACSIVGTAAAGDVYRWKDAHGVTHFGSSPPAKGTYKVHPIRESDMATVAAPAKPAENPACATARNNVTLLQGKASLQVDSDGDGKPDKTLSDADRANQMQLAEATLKVNCASPVANKVATPTK